VHMILMPARDLLGILDYQVLTLDEELANVGVAHAVVGAPLLWCGQIHVIEIINPFAWISIIVS
jgi:hypothetical protein